MRRAVLVAFAGVFALPTVFATASGSAERFGGIPVDPESLQPPGTKLGNGFSVAAGTALVGDVFPVPTVYHFRGETRVVDRGWRAVLLVEGDPRKVMEAYRRQALDVGIELRSGPSLCDFSEIDARIYECSAIGVTSSPDRRQVSFSILRGPGYYGPMSHLNVVYNDPDPDAWVVLDPGLTSDAAPGPEPPPVPTDWGRLAQPRDFFFGDSYRARDSFVAPPFKVEPGSTPAAPVGPALPTSGPTFAAYGSSYDWMAVLRVTGKASDVVGAYRRQLRLNRRTFGPLSRTVTARPRRGTTVYEFSSELLGGWDHHVEVVHRSSGTWMLVRAYAQT